MHKKSHAELIKGFEDKDRDHWQKPNLVITLMGKIQNKKVIDIGSGSGYFTKFFLENGALTTAADVDQTFLDFIGSRFKNQSNLRLKKIEFSNPLMGNNEYDFAFTCNTYHHIENRIDYFKKVYKGLAQNGAVVIVDFKKDLKEKTFGPALSMRISQTQVESELKAAGFRKVITDRESLIYQYIVIAYKNN